MHFVGVGGASMCALAEYCLLAGAEVSGSDRVRSAALGRLAALGAEVYLGARRDTIARAGLVVRSSAVPLTDEEDTCNISNRAMKSGMRATSVHSKWPSVWLLSVPFGRCMATLTVRISAGSIRRLSVFG